MSAITSGLKCDSCGRFMGAPTEPTQVIPVRDSIHPYTADYRYLCAECAENNEREEKG